MPVVSRGFGAWKTWTGELRLERTGRLQYLAPTVGWTIKLKIPHYGPLGMFECVDCRQLFFSQNDCVSVIEARVIGDINKIILLCPWCRPDSQAGCYGRMS